MLTHLQNPTLDNPDNKTFGQQLRTELNWPTCQCDPITNIAL